MLDVSLTDPLTSPAGLSIAAVPGSRAQAGPRSELAQMADSGSGDAGVCVTIMSPSPLDVTTIITTAHTLAAQYHRPANNDSLGKFLSGMCANISVKCVILTLITVIRKLEDERMTWSWSWRMIM